MNTNMFGIGDFILESRTNFSMDYYCSDPTVGPEVVYNPFIYIVGKRGIFTWPWVFYPLSFYITMLLSSLGLCQSISLQV